MKTRAELVAILECKHLWRILLGVMRRCALCDLTLTDTAGSMSEFQEWERRSRWALRHDQKAPIEDYFERRRRLAELERRLREAAAREDVESWREA